MMVLRRVQKNDLDGILSLATTAGVGLTSLPPERDTLQQRIAHALESFERLVREPRDEMYLFVLENIDTGSITGVSAIEAALGLTLPFYSYRILHQTRINHEMAIRNDHDLLHPVNDFQGASELCTLYLAPPWRHGGNGLLLSRARFLYMANFPNRFAKTVIADMRGISDESGCSPFWEAVGRHFFQMDFAKADQLTATTNKQFIADLMPKHPIYVSLLPKEAQAVIGKPHPSSVAAMNMLLQEGFHPTGCVDIFDAGPTIEAETRRVRTLANSRVFTIKTLSDSISSRTYLIANTRADFRASMGKSIVNMEKNTCLLDRHTAEHLGIKPGDCVRIAPLHANESPQFQEHS
ncbi:arginine N-succinyltransferase [Legionella geestiana]|uniref:arginine N-succinyltransferase n=1 Tax=Legionella geestiana TaxID=45065 RepID=UPI0010921734|nr:arginine N-succinyltransferase [Legionella geestiana]QDQ40596.1 arginine N-succinyltransferase [Legionella geestiana]